MTLELVSDGNDGDDGNQPTIESYRDQIDDCRFEVEHVAALLDMLGEECTPNDRSEQSDGWSRVQFLAKLLQERVATVLAAASEGIELLEMKRRREEPGKAS